MSNVLRGTIVNPDVIRGKSAYEIAVMHGFEGTEEEWVEALHDDAKAKRAEEAAVDARQSANKAKASQESASASAKIAEQAASTATALVEENSASAAQAATEKADEVIAQRVAELGTVVQTVGDSVTAVMSQKATTDTLSNAGIISKKTASGNIIKVSDIASREHMVKVKVTCPDGVDPTTVSVTACRKNLIPFPYSLLSGTTTKSGIKASFQVDGGMCFNGRCWVVTWWWLSDVNLGTEVIDIASTSLGFIANSEYSTYDVMNNGANARCRTFYNPQGQAGQPRAYIQLSKGTYENVVVYPQIEVGKESTEYVKGDENTTVALDETGEAEVKSSAPEMCITVGSGRTGYNITAEYIEYFAEVDKTANSLEGEKSGSIIQLPDVSPIPHKIKVSSETPDASVMVAGKNLIPFPYSALKGTTTKNGITATVQEDGGVCFYGTSTEITYWSLCNVDLGSAVVTCVSKDGLIANADVPTKMIQNGSRNPKWRTVYEAGTWHTILIQLSAGTYDNMVAYPQIEAGYESTDYEKGKESTDTLALVDGCAEMTSTAGTLTMWTTDGSKLNVSYNRDINAAFGEASKLYKGYGLPVLYFSGDTSEMTKDDKVTLAYKYDEKVGTCTMKWQGTSSIAYPKKNYTVTFDNAFEAVDGWGEQKKYCLKANYIDFSHIRNVCSAKLWGSIVKKRGNINAKLAATPNYGAVDGFPVCVVINNEYVGLYTFCVPKDAWMMGMGDGAQEAIVCAEGDPYLANKFKSTADTLDGAFDIEYVTDENNTAWVETSLNRLIQACIDSDGTDLDTTIAQYLDWDSAIDYFIYCAAIGHYDGMYKNYLLSTYDGVKWFFTAYDMDSVLGSRHTGKNVFSAKAYDPVVLSQNHKVFDLIYKYKMDEVRARFKAIAEDNNLPLHEEQVIIVFSDYVAQIPKALFDEDCKIWKTIPGTSYNNINQITAWYHRRFAYLKEWFG